MKSMHHSFDIDLASKYGMTAAILIHHFQHWISFNQKLKRNFIQDRTWTFQTRQEICSHFTYLSEKEVRGAIRRLVEADVIMKGKFNKTPFDQTIWYAFVNEGEFLNNSYNVTKGPMEVAKGPIRCLQKGQPIPDTKQDTKQIPPLPPPKDVQESVTLEEEEELSRRLRDRGNKAPKINSMNLWRRKVLKSIRDEAVGPCEALEFAKRVKDSFPHHKDIRVEKNGIEFILGGSGSRVILYTDPGFEEQVKSQLKRWGLSIDSIK